MIHCNDGTFSSFIIDKINSKTKAWFADICDSECKFTRTGFSDHKKAIEALNLTEIQNNISGIKISMLNIDPVPGGNALLITRLKGVAWRDQRFYTIPPIVNEYEQYVYQNERSRAFKVIVPTVEAPEKTTFKLIGLPGHHGTGSGNLFDQQRELKAEDGFKPSEHVQQLLVLKIVDFLNHKGVKFTPPKNDPFNDMVSDLLKASEYKSNLKSLYHGIYDQIMSNIADYERYNNTSYQTLQEQGFLKLIGWDTPQRIIHFQAHNDTFLHNIMTLKISDHFLNYEHARIRLDKIFGFDSKLPLDKVIEQSVGTLVDYCKHFNTLEALEASKINKGSPIDMTQSLLADPLAQTLTTKEGFELLLDGVGVLIKEVETYYLQSFYSQNDPLNITQSVALAFESIKNVLINNPTHKLAKTILTSFNENINSAVSTKREELINKYKTLSEQLKGNVFFVTLQSNINQIKIVLEEKSADPSAKLLISKLNKFNDDLTEFALSNPDSAQKRVFIEEQMTSINNLQMTSDLESSIVLVKLYMTEAMDDTDNDNLPNLMGQVISAYNDLDQFEKSLPNLKQLNNDLNIDKLEKGLEAKRSHMISLTSQYIVRQKLDLEQDVQPLFENNDKLYQMVKGLAIAFGATNPLNLKLAEITHQNADFKEKLHNLKSENSSLQQEKDALGVDKQQLKQKIEEANHLVSDILRKNEILSLERTRLGSEKQTISNKVEQLSNQLNTISSKKDDLLAQIAQEGEHNSALNLEVGKLDEAIASLESEQEHLTQENINLSSELDQLTQQINDLELRLNNIIQDRNQMEQNNSDLVQANNIMNQNNKLLEGIINSDSEFKCQTLIKNKLLPLTKDYLIHLGKEIQQLVDPDITVNDDVKSLFAQVSKIDAWPQDKSVQQLKEKYDAVSSLYKTLIDPTTPKPSDKVTRFYTELDKADSVIKQHRDASWKRFTLNTIAILGIIISGILPGLAILAIASAISGKSPMFWKSSGETFFKKSIESKDIESPDMMIPNPPSPAK